MPAVQFHPLAAQPHQGDLKPGELGQIVGVQFLVAEGQVIAEVDDVRQAEHGLRTPAAARCLPRPGSDLETKPRLARPVRQQHAEPGARQQRAGLAQETERTFGVQRDAGRRGAAEFMVKLGKEPGGTAEPGEEFFLRVTDPGRGPAARANAGPDVGRGQQQARIAGRLQGELDGPGRVRGVRSAGGTGRGPGDVGHGGGGPGDVGHGRGGHGDVGHGDVGHRGCRLDQPEAGADRPDRDLRRTAPGIKVSLERRCLGLVLRR